MNPDSPFRFGHAALMGRPNVGKSSLLNVFVGAHLVAVSDKPHTTRQNLIGVRNFEHAQIAFVDTPGLQRRRPTAVHKSMDRSLAVAVDQVDLVVLVIEAGRWKEGDSNALERARSTHKPVALIINKVDLINPRSALLPFIAEVSKRHDFAAVLLVSARKSQGTEEACKRLAELLPVADPGYAADALTDRSERFIAAEMVREQLMRQLGAEVPYACAVEIEAYELEGELRRIAATIWVEREGQKAIVIGDAGERLKQIGTLARTGLEELFGGKIFLKLWVKVRADWSDDARSLRQLGFE